MNEEKRMAGDYEIIHAIHIGDREVVVGDNPNAVLNERFMCAYAESNDFFCRYDDVIVSDDFPEIIALFGKRVAEQAEKTRAELFTPIVQGIDIHPLQQKDCNPISYDDDLMDKIVVIKPDVFRREYQRSTHQIKVCSGGFGATPHSRGSACYCVDLYTGKTSRFERKDIMGTLEIDQLPKWAKQCLEMHLNQQAHKGRRKEACL